MVRKSLSATFLFPFLVLFVETSRQMMHCKKVILHFFVEIKTLWPYAKFFTSLSM